MYAYFLNYFFRKIFILEWKCDFKMKTNVSFCYQLILERALARHWARFQQVFRMSRLRLF